MIALAKQHDLNDANINLFQRRARRDAEFAEKSDPMPGFVLLCALCASASSALKAVNKASPPCPR